MEEVSGQHCTQVVGWLLHTVQIYFTVGKKRDDKSTVSLERSTKELKLAEGFGKSCSSCKMNDNRENLQTAPDCREGKAPLV